MDETRSIVSSLLKPEESRDHLDYINLSILTLSKCDEIFNYVNAVIVNRTYNKKTPLMVYDIMLSNLDEIFFDRPVYRNAGDYLGSAADRLRIFQKKFKDLEKSINGEVSSIDLERSKKIFADSNNFLSKIHRVYVELYDIKIHDSFSL
jgi:hypothetical protein